MNKKRKREVLWLTFQYAKLQADSVIDAYSHIPEDKGCLQARKELREITELQKELFGTTQSQLDIYLSQLKTMTFSEIKEMREGQFGENKGDIDGKA